MCIFKLITFLNDYFTKYREGGMIYLKVMKTSVPKERSENFFLISKIKSNTFVCVFFVAMETRRRVVFWHKW